MDTTVNLIDNYFKLIIKDMEQKDISFIYSGADNEQSEGLTDVGNDEKNSKEMNNLEKNIKI